MKRVNLSKPASLLVATFVLATGISLTSCSKDDDKKPEETPTEQPQPNPTGSTTPQFTSGEGTLVAVKSESTTSTPFGPIVNTVGTAVAVFYNTPGASTFLDAGTVKTNEKTLTKQSNNSYVFQPSVNAPEGIEFDSSPIHWEVSGSGNVGTIDEFITMGFPTVEQITSGGTASKSAGYTLTTSAVTGADSVIFLVGDVVRTVSGNATSHSFTSGDLSGLNKGTTIAQIAAYIIDSRSVDGKTYHFVNETVVSKTITIED
jgi:hypothetical protein